MRTHWPIRFSLAAVTGLMLAGCCTSKECQMQRVAKDWCLTIRASQVIPVYPLTEDVLPGDVFLAGRQIQDEQAEYTQKGFLPLSQLVVRLHPQNIEEFYLSSHGTAGKTNPPYFWRFDGPNSQTNNLRLMPRAAFPTYHFSTRRGGGLNVAVPVQGIPIAMNLLSSAQVDGTVLLKDAYTFGVDQVNLQNQLLDWVDENEAFLRHLAPTKGSTNYLRMVSRIFLVGAVNVLVNSTESFSGSLAGGVDKPVNLPNLAGTYTVESYTNALAALSSSLATALNAPGGTLKVAAASSRSVSLDETFPRPLVVGYLGFDFQILPNGKLSLPRPTLHRLNKKAATAPVGELVYTYAANEDSALLRDWLADDAHRKTATDWLARNYPGVNLANVITAPQLRDVRHRIMQELIKKQ